MVPNGTAYSNFPPFAVNGIKTPPGGSPESAKYALGMVPADTYPAEWANYFLHGSTAGITRLNQDTGSIKKEINSVLSNYNITPDPTVNTQLMEALNKLKAEAALAAHPVGSLYWTSVNENPAVIFGGGTWVQIKDRFVLAAGDTYTNGDTGGAATVTLTTTELPRHTHTGTTDNGGVDHTHEMNHRHYTGGTTGDISANHTHDISHTHISYVYGRQTNATGGSEYAVRGGDGMIQASGTSGASPSTSGYVSNGHVHSWGDWSSTPRYWGNEGVERFNTGGASAYNHTHTFTTEASGGGGAHNNMPPYVVKYCWERTA